MSFFYVKCDPSQNGVLVKKYNAKKVNIVRSSLHTLVHLHFDVHFCTEVYFIVLCDLHSHGIVDTIR